jgi:hypothetical protein
VGRRRDDPRLRDRVRDQRVRVKTAGRRRPAVVPVATRRAPCA